jgi:uncharacterized membrane protein YdjX (TVP38/TMEM64 family)
VRPRLRLALVAAGVAAVAVLVLLTVSRSPSRVRDIVDSVGVVAPLVFIAISAPLSAAFFPGPLLAGASGLLFGTALGTPVTIVAATLGALLAFTIARYGGRGAIEGVGGERVEEWQRRIERRGFVAVLYARIAPAMPFTLVNYAAGLTRVKMRDFALATVIGISPRAFAYTALGGHFTDLSSPEAIVAIAILVVMAVAGAAFALRGRRPGLPG